MPLIAPPKYTFPSGTGPVSKENGFGFATSGPVRDGVVSDEAGASSALASFVPGGGATRFGSGLVTCASEAGTAPNWPAAASSDTAPTTSGFLDLCIILSPSSPD